MDSSDKNDLIVGEGVRLVGEVHAPGLLRLHGTIEGDVRGDDVRVGPGGRIEGSLDGCNVDLEGHVSERIVAKTLALRSSASVSGSVEYETLEIEAGAQIEGTLNKAEPRETAHADGSLAYLTAVQDRSEEVTSGEQDG